MRAPGTPFRGHSTSNAPLTVESLQRDVAGFVTIAQFLHRLTGIHLPANPKNLSLMAGRLAPILRARGLVSYAEYFAVVTGRDAVARHELVRSMTTNTTSFFREPEHFSFLARALPAVLERKRQEKNRELRFWCAASSTGQEAYSMLMMILETLEVTQAGGEAWTIKFLATDIDDTALRHAGRGIYTDAELGAVPERLRNKYWTRDAATGRWKASPRLRDRLKLATFNLVTNPYPFRFRFDFVFCRNVFIYFNREHVPPILDRMADVMQPGAFLFLGHAEAGLVQSSRFRIAAPSVYERLPTATERRGK